MSGAPSPSLRGSARRRFLRAAPGVCAFACLSPIKLLAATRAPQRVIVLNWELTETLLALGRVPVGIPLPDWYTRTIVTPPLPQHVIDVGLLYQPNFDVLLDLAPDLLIVTPQHAGLLAPLRRIAPTLTLGAYMNAPKPLDALRGETLAMAHALATPGAQARANTLIAGTDFEIGAVEARLRGTVQRPVIVADAIDERHLRVYARGSLFDDVLARIGVENAANPRDAVSGNTSSEKAGNRAAAKRWTANAIGSAVVPLQKLVDVANADILLVGPLQPQTRAALAESALWRALPAVRERRVSVLPVIAPYGGLVSMQRFASAVETALGAFANGGASGGGGLG